jgi:hypothetical protein
MIHLRKRNPLTRIKTSARAGRACGGRKSLAGYPVNSSSGLPPDRSLIADGYGEDYPVPNEAVPIHIDALSEAITSRQP